MDTIDVEILATVVNNGTGNFDELTNRPKYNSSTMSHETNIPEVKTETWDAKYTKPATGIPKVDFAADVQTSLSKADSAIQEHQSLSAYRTAAAQDVIDAGKYIKPATGIPKTDMASDVQTSLGKADTAIQEHQSLAAYRTSANQDIIDTALSNSISEKYAKPATGIPKTDLTEAAQTSLGKADTALQEHQSLSAYRTASAQDAIDATKAAASDLTAHTGNTNNPHSVTAEQTTYDSAATSHTSGSVAAQLSEHSGQIVTLGASLTNKTATTADEGKFAKVKTVENGAVTEWEFGEGGGGGDTAGVVAPAYSALSTYAKGSLVVYNQKLYEANQNIDVAEAWTEAHWSETTMSAVLAEEYQRYGHVTVSCVDASSSQISGVTITVKSQIDGTTFGTYNYNGTPITVKTPYGYPYKMIPSYKSGYVTPAPIFGTGTSTATVTFTYKTGVIYGFHISNSESNPASKVTYIQGTDSYDMTPAHMDFQNDEFNYGSWENAFFMPKPCMLKYDGTVDYYLDPDDYTKREDGITLSDVSDENYQGNAMIEWGQNGQKIWYKIVPDNNDNYSASIYISNEQVDSDYVAWSFIDSQNNYINHFYTPIFNGSLVSSKLRSISGKAPWNTTGGAQPEINAAIANNVNGNAWYTEVLSDIQLINFLLILIGKTTQIQDTFGYGHYTGGTSASSLINSGTMNTKGMFWGSTATGVGVKVFGMENFWGNQWRRYGGHMNLSNTQKFKMTAGTADGSTASNYNVDGTGYITIGEQITGISGNYISKMKFIPKLGMFPVKVEGSSSTYYCDGAYFASGTMYAYRGGACSSGLIGGMFAVVLSYPASNSHWVLGAAPSCKPLASVG